MKSEEDQRARDEAAEREAFQVKWALYWARILRLQLRRRRRKAPSPSACLTPGH